MWRRRIDGALRWKWIVAGLSGAIAGVSATVWACGPFFATRALGDRDGAVLSAPPPGYERAVHGLAPAVKPAFQAKGGDIEPAEQTRAAEESDLREALGAAGLPAEKLEAIVRASAATRAAIAAGGLDRKPAPAVPSGLPPEFADYLRGAIAYHQCRVDDALRAFEAILARPKAERPYRSTWAAFMIGKLYLETGEPAKAAPWFEKTRALAREGHRDSLGLAASSYGWQAKAELDQKHFERASELYFEQLPTGDAWAAASLRVVAQELLKAAPAALAKAAEGPAVRRALIAYLVSDDAAHLADANSNESRLMATLLAQTEGQKDVAGADRLAWAAYQAGAMKTAARWLDRAPQGSAVASWIRAKLLLRAGKLDEAMKLFASTVKAMPTATGEGDEGDLGRDRVAEELAVLRMARGQYIEALDLLLRHGEWVDAAYVAERVLTADELRAYVDKHAPESAPAESREANLRYLLARRLARLSRLDDARPYYPKPMRPRLDAYAKALREAKDRRRSAEPRADGFWAAAQIARHEGMELLGTEVDPDWHMHDGQYEEETTVPGKGKTRIPITRDERDRAAENKPAPERRFHYRYIAADHAAEAAKLLPDRSKKLVTVLCTAHGWLKNRDPKAAAQFYKELVKRGGTGACPSS
jgi:hypothetical protein